MRENIKWVVSAYYYEVVTCYHELLSQLTLATKIHVVCVKSGAMLVLLLGPDIPYLLDYMPPSNKPPLFGG